VQARNAVNRSQEELDEQGLTWLERQKQESEDRQPLGQLAIYSTSCLMYPLDPLFAS
jgi:hypothetical protein